MIGGLGAPGSKPTWYGCGLVLIQNKQVQARKQVNGCPTSAWQPVKCAPYVSHGSLGHITLRHNNVLSLSSSSSAVLGWLHVFRSHFQVKEPRHGSSFGRLAFSFFAGRVPGHTSSRVMTAFWPGGSRGERQKFRHKSLYADSFPPTLAILMGPSTGFDCR